MDLTQPCFATQRPILLHGHIRSLTRVKYNREGDLIFSVSKDNKPNVWFAHNGERLGSYHGHNGTVWDLDISCMLITVLASQHSTHIEHIIWCYRSLQFTDDSKRLLTGSADSSARLWDVQTGKELFRWDTRTAVRAVAFAQGDKKALYVTDAIMGQPCTLCVVPVEDNMEDRRCRRRFDFV